jgi:hypothetical protein
MQCYTGLFTFYSGSFFFTIMGINHLLLKNRLTGSRLFIQMTLMAIWNLVAEEATVQVGWPGGQQQSNKHKQNYHYSHSSRSMPAIIMAVAALSIS